MFNKVFENIHESDLNSLINDINKLVYNGELTEIIEVTYSYNKLSDWTNFNKTLFQDFLLLEIDDIENEFKNYKTKWTFKYNKRLLLRRLWSKVWKKINSTISIIDNYIAWLSALLNLSEGDKIKQDLLIDSLEYTKNTLKMALVWLPFELKKAWLPHNLSEEEIVTKVKELDNLNAKNFWWKISSNPEEVILSYEFLRDKFEIEKEKLSDDEQNEYKKIYLSKIEELLPEDYLYQDKEIEVKNNNEPEINILNTKVPREKYIFILKTVFDILDLDFDVIVDERSSIYDGPTALHIPSSKKYDNLSVKRIVELIWHEIESHSVNLKNNEILLGLFRWAWNLTKEEGLAMVVENLLNGVSLDDIKTPQHFSKILVAELFDWVALDRFLMLQNKIQPDTWYEGRLLRLKRLYPMWYVWWQKKDASYWRGVIEVVKFITEWNDIRDLYLWKTSIEDIPKIKKLMQLKWISYNDLHLPIFIWELVLFLFNAEDNNKNSRNKIIVTQENFVVYLKDKYPFINFDDIEIHIEWFFTKRKVLDIIKTFRSL